jgi:hypothetical protein
VQGYVFARPLEAAQLAAGAWDVTTGLPGATAGSPAVAS